MAETVSVLRRRVETLAGMLDDFERRPTCDLTLYRVVARGLRAARRSLEAAHRAKRRMDWHLATARPDAADHAES